MAEVATHERERIVIKIGTDLLTLPNKELNIPFIERIAAEVAELRASGRYEITIVTSGAVAAGRTITGDFDSCDIKSKQALASIGQPELMRIYEEALAKHNITRGQLLVEKGHFERESSRQNLLNCYRRNVEYGSVVIWNENDPAETEELNKMSNDILGANVANLINADRLVMLTNQNGIYNKNPDEHEDAALQSFIGRKTYEQTHISTKGKSNGGTGGASTKLEAGRIFNGITHIAHGHRVSLADILNGEASQTKMAGLPAIIVQQAEVQAA